MNPDIQDIFRVRSRIIAGVRNYLDNRGFLEVCGCEGMCVCVWVVVVVLWGWGGGAGGQRLRWGWEAMRVAWGGCRGRHGRAWMAGHARRRRFASTNAHNIVQSRSSHSLAHHDMPSTR